MSDIQRENIKYALCYIPLLAIVILFIEENKDEKLKKHIRRGLILFGIYFLLSFFIGFFYFAFFLNGLLTFIYIVISIYLGYKAYKGEDFNIPLLDDLESKIKDIFK